MSNPIFNKNGAPLTANQVALQKVKEEARITRFKNSHEVAVVLKYAPYLLPFVGEILEVYTKGGVRGFKFTPSNYDQLKRAIDRHLQGFIVDGLKEGGGTDAVGAFMGSDAKKHGFIFSLRSKSDFSSLHIELKKTLCDAHIDSVSTTAAMSGPYWGAGGQYNPTKFADHFIKDLLPFYLEKPPSIPVLGTLLRNPSVYKMITTGLSRTSVEFKLNESFDASNSVRGIHGTSKKDTRFLVHFTVLEWK